MDALRLKTSLRAAHRARLGLTLSVVMPRCVSKRGCDPRVDGCGKRSSETILAVCRGTVR
jgi:hypothetical protein